MDDLITQAVLLLFGGAFAGLILGAGFSWLRGRLVGGDQFVAGIALGMTVFALCTCFGAARVAHATWQQQRGMVPIEGKLVDYVAETSTDAKTRRTTTLMAPRVEYVVDGRSYSVKGLGSSQADRSPGDPVPLLVSPVDPAQAVIADFQNQWGAVWALSGFGGFGLLAALFFGGTAIGENRERKRRLKPGRPEDDLPSNLVVAWHAWRLRHGKRFQQSFHAAAALTLVAAMLFPVFSSDDALERSMAITFAGVASAMVCFGFGALFSSRPSGMALGVLGILAAGFGFFAFGLWMLSAV